MLPTDAPELLHVGGYVTGATLYAMLLAMVLRAGAGRDRLTLATAIFGLGWNVSELTAHALAGLSLPTAATWVSAASYAALGFLSSVAVHSAGTAHAGTPSATPPRWRVTTILAYGCATVAGLIQLAAAARGSSLPSPFGLLFLTGGLLAVAPVLYLDTRRQPQRRRALWMIGLALFAVSALHLSNYHGAAERWPTELLGHHASIPLAFAILYQDYRFALADIFLKRAITLVVLVGIVFAAWSAIASFVTGGAELSSAAIGVLLLGWIATALLFPRLQRLVQAFVDRVVLRRIDYDSFVDDLAAAVERQSASGDVLDLVSARIAPVLSAESVTWRPSGGAMRSGATEFVVPTVEEPSYSLVVDGLTGGRRLLSDDQAMLQRVAIVAARRIDALRLDEERHQRLQREREISALATEAELRALRSQINPHFLFNALTTLGYLIQSAPPRALDTLMRLTTLLRAVLRSESEFTTLGQEQELIDCYLSIEAERFEERLDARVDIPDALRHLPIPALIVQPLVENAVKHGIAPSRSGGAVAVSATRDVSQADMLLISVRNTGAPLQTGSTAVGCGIGLQNVRDRLRAHYGEAATLSLHRDAAGATVAELRLPATIGASLPRAAMAGGAR
jgi:hypothetical protein